MILGELQRLSGHFQEEEIRFSLTGNKLWIDQPVIKLLHQLQYTGFNHEV
jgi:hypothetical protein